MPKEFFSTSTPSPVINPTLKDCNYDPETCPFVKGILVKGKLYDAVCSKPIKDEEIDVLVSGWNIHMKRSINEIKKINCGKVEFNKGIKRNILSSP